MPQFVHKFVVNAPLDTVLAFHSDSTALRDLTPPPAIVQFHQVNPMAELSILRFTMWFGPVPISWTSVHVDVSENGFTDLQLNGPYKSWAHRHRFEAISKRKTCIHDQIEAEFSNSFPKYFVSRVMWTSLPLLFRYRAWQTKRTCE